MVIHFIGSAGRWTRSYQYRIQLISPQSLAIWLLKQTIFTSAPGGFVSRPGTPLIYDFLERLLFFRGLSADNLLKPSCEFP